MIIKLKTGKGYAKIRYWQGLKRVWEVYYNGLEIMN